MDAIQAVVSNLLHFAGETLQVLVVFNVLFICMFFPLNGSLRRKMAILAIGNIFCLTLNTLFSMFAAILAAFMGDFSKALFAVLSPMFNLLWIVSFWSVSLTFLAKSKRGGDE